MDVENLTIRAELVDETGPGAASARANVAGVAAATTQANVAAGAAASGGLARLNNQFAALEKVGKSLGSSISDLVGWVGSKLEAAAQRGARALELLGIGAVAWGLKVTASLQQSRLAMDTFLGSVSAGDRMFNQLKSLQGPFNIGSLTQGAQSLLTAGASPDQAIALTRAIANIAAPQVDPNSAFQSISQAVNRIQETGRIEPRALLAFMSSGVDAYGLLAQEMGIPRDQVRKQLQEIMKTGGDTAAPANFLSDLAGLNGPLAKFRGGQAAQRQTLGGEASMARIQVGQTLAAITAPVASWLQRDILPKVSGWATGVQQRAPGLLPGIGADLKGGDMSGAARMIDELVGGGGKLVPLLDPLLKGLQSLFRIFKDEVIPAGKDLLKIAVPALHMLDDVLSFMAGHKGLMEGLIVSLVGIAGVRAAVGPVTQLAGAFGGLRSAIGAGDFLGAASAFLKGLFGIGGTSPGGIVPGGGGGGGGGGSIIPVGGGGSFLGKALGGVALGAGEGFALTQLIDHLPGAHPNAATNKAFNQVIGAMAAGGGIGMMVGGPLGALIGGAAAGIGDAGYQLIFGHHKKAGPVDPWTSDKHAPQWAKDARAKAAAQDAMQNGGVAHVYAIQNLNVVANNPQQLQAALANLDKANQERGYQSPYNPNTT